MADTVQNGKTRGAQLVGAVQIAREAEVRQSSNGVRFATYGETGVADVELDRILEAVPLGVTSALNANTYYFVPLAMREPADRFNTVNAQEGQKTEPTLISSGYTEELSDAAICHRNVALDHGRQGVFISTRLMGDRFALSFEFFINVAHAFTDAAGVPKAFEDLVWRQALDDIRGETSADAWESRNVAFGRPPNAPPEVQQPTSRRSRGAAFAFAAGQRTFAGGLHASAAPNNVVQMRQRGEDADQGGPAQETYDEKDRAMYLASAFSDALAIYLLSLALDFDYMELREREYPLLAPAALAARLRLVAELYPPNQGYEFAVRYRHRG